MLVLLALALLLASVAFGYFVWVRPVEGNLDSRSKALLLFVVLTLFGAFWGAGPWWFDEKESFAWDLPPLASRMLGAAAIAFVVAGLVALSGTVYHKLRLMVLMTAVYVVPLTFAILVFNLDYFDFDEPVVWGFFPLAAVMCSTT